MAKAIDKTSDQYLANKVSVIALITNLMLSSFKLFAGIFAHSGAMISDAVHSTSDVLTTVMVMFGINISALEDDDNHQYGHEKIESLVGTVMAIMLMVTALGIGYSGIKTLFALRSGNGIRVPGGLALVAALVSIISQEAMFWYTRAAGKKINSQALIADAWHHRSDAMSSVGSFIGIGGAMLGWTFLDPVVSIGICIVIGKVAFDIGRTSIDQLIDKAADKETVEIIEKAVMEIDGVIRIDDLKTRLHSKKLFVDLEIAVDGDMTTWQTHAIAERVHDNVESICNEVKHIMVHVNPV